MKAKSQLEAVKLHLDKFGHITSKTANDEYGASRCSDIIYKLRRKGMNITTIPQDHITRFGNKGQHGIYKLIE